MADTVQRIYELIIRAGGAKTGADQFKAAADSMGVSAQAVAANYKKLTDGVAASDREWVKFQRTYDQVGVAQQKAARDIAVVQRRIEAQRITTDEAAVSLQRIAARYDQAVERANRFGQGLGGAGAAGGRFGGAMQQAGYQVGDLAVQLQMGTDPIRAFTQQGSQLLGMFGPWGAVIGAGAAVVGALATSFFGLEDASKQAKDAQDAYNKTLETANDLMEKLNGKADASRENLLQQRQALVTFKQAELDTAQAALDRTPEFAPNSRSPVKIHTAEWTAQAEKVRTLNRELADLKATLGFFGGGHGNRIGLNDDIQALIDRNPKLFGGETESTKTTPAEDQAKRISDTIKDLQLQINSFDLSPTEQKVAAALAKIDFKMPGAEQGAIDIAELTRTLAELSDQAARDKKDVAEIDAIIEEATRGADQRQQWLKNALSSQQNQMQLLKAQIGGANDNDGSLAMLKARQEAEAQFGSLLDANAQRYIENAKNIATMNKELERQRAEAEILPQFFGQVVDRIGEATTMLAVQKGEWADWRNVAMGVLSEVQNMLFKLSISNPLQNWIGGSNLPTAGGLLGKLFGGGGQSNWQSTTGNPHFGGGGGGIGGFFSDIFSGIGSLFGFDQGGVMTNRGPVPLRRYEAGGVATSPQLAMFGEGRRPEAYVPLADGRSIPVSLQMAAPGNNNRPAPQMGGNVTYAPVITVNAPPGTDQRWLNHVPAMIDQRVRAGFDDFRRSINSGGNDAKLVGRRN